MPFETAGDQHCANCLANPPRHDGIKAAVAYGDVARQVVLKLKYGGKVGLANVIAAQLVRHLPTETKGMLIVPVPLHWSRLWSRSYNQSALIAKALARDRNMIFAPDLLLRTKKTPVLRGMSAAQRKRAVSGAFVIHKKWQSQISGAKIILVDDIYTTGATANACVKSLKASQASSVQIFCWARVLRGEALEEHNHGDATGILV